jgi:hypothetical protein
MKGLAKTTAMITLKQKRSFKENQHAFRGPDEGISLKK